MFKQNRLTYKVAPEQPSQPAPQGEREPASDKHWEQIYVAENHLKGLKFETKDYDETAVLEDLEEYLGRSDYKALKLEMMVASGKTFNTDEIGDTENFSPTKEMIKKWIDDNGGKNFVKRLFVLGRNRALLDFSRVIDKNEDWWVEQYTDMSQLEVIHNGITEIAYKNNKERIEKAIAVLAERALTEEEPPVIGAAETAEPLPPKEQPRDQMETDDLKTYFEKYAEAFKTKGIEYIYNNPPDTNLRDKIGANFEHVFKIKAQYEWEKPGKIYMPAVVGQATSPDENGGLVDAPATPKERSNKDFYYGVSKIDNGLMIQYQYTYQGSKRTNIINVDPALGIENFLKQLEFQHNSAIQNDEINHKEVKRKYTEKFMKE